MAERVDAIDLGLSRERVVSRRAGRTTGCANRAVVEGESLSVLIAVIKFENLPEPPPTKILCLQISNSFLDSLPVLPRAQADYFQALCAVALHVFFPKKITYLTDKFAISISILDFAENHLLSIYKVFKF